jgi:acyl-CoA thioester hydrolase
MHVPFRYYLRVRYAECDAQKVVFNARYADYVDLAATEFLRAIGFGAEIISGALDYQVVKQTIEWKSPARFDQVLAIAVETVKLGHTSFTLGHTFRIADEDRVIAAAETVYVNVNPETLVKEPLPAEFRIALEQGAPNVTTDHAGLAHSTTK